MSPQVTAAIIAVGGVVLTVIATVAVQISGRRATSRDTQQALKEQREQLDTTLAAQREQLDRTLAEQRTRTLNERFATAAGQLGGDKPAAVRLAGVYAMAGLADDWKENRQTCVDVLCAYLRLPHDPDPGEDAKPAERADYLASREVRHTVIRVITAHLQAAMAEAKSWRGLRFDFTGAVFDGGDFSRAAFSGGRVSFNDATFSGGKVSFFGATFSGAVDFSGAEFSAGEVSFFGAEFSSGAVGFVGATFSGGRVSFHHATFSGGIVGFEKRYSLAASSTSTAPTSPAAPSPSSAPRSPAVVSVSTAPRSTGATSASSAPSSPAAPSGSSAPSSSAAWSTSAVPMTGHALPYLTGRTRRPQV